MSIVTPVINALRRASTVPGHPSGPSLSSLKILAFDLETTGPNPDVDLIVQIGMVRIAAGELQAPEAMLINPGGPIPPDTAAFHGITDEVVADAPLFVELAGQLAAAFEDADALLTYNGIRFDMPILEREFAAAGIKPKLPPVIDLFPWVNWAFRGEARNLKAMCRKFGIELNKAHDAKHDIVATAQLAGKMLAAGRLIPELKTCLTVQARLADLHQAESEAFGQLLWLDRKDGILRCGGKRGGGKLMDADLGWIRWALGRKGLPEPARVCLQRAIDLRVGRCGWCDKVHPGGPEGCKEAANR